MGKWDELESALRVLAAPPTDQEAHVLGLGVGELARQYVDASSRRDDLPDGVAAELSTVDAQLARMAEPPLRDTAWTEAAPHTDPAWARLRELARHAGEVLDDATSSTPTDVTLDGRAHTTSKAFHDFIADTFTLPHYGANLDALRDALTGMIARPLRLTWTHAQVSRAAMGEEYTRLVGILTEAARADEGFDFELRERD